MNKQLYFYHLVNKDASLEPGIISLKYMYDYKLYDLFDKYIEKYHERITKHWNIPKYANKETLTREEYLDALTTYRGKEGPNYIYFFRYPPTSSLGPHMASILKDKDIYCLDINAPETKTYIKDIFYGYKDSHSDNESLAKKYYEEVTEEEYFKNYDDSSAMNYAKLNHIAISFKDGYCPKHILTKITR